MVLDRLAEEDVCEIQVVAHEVVANVSGARHVLEQV